MIKEKVDGQCLAPSCEARVDWSKWDKPPPGWAILTYDRYSKKAKAHRTFLLCPGHTINFARKQTPLAEAVPHRFKRIIIESPFSGISKEDLARNQRYLRAAMRDAILRGEAPFASHGLYTQEGVLDDRKSDERQLGMEAGFAWIPSAEASVAYEDLGMSGGMIEGIRRAEQVGKPTERRKIIGWKP